MKSFLPVLNNKTKGRLILMFLSIFCFILSVSAYNFWTESGNVFFTPTDNFYWLYSSQTPSHHTQGIFHCTFSFNNDFSPIIYDFNFDEQNDIMVFDDANIRIYNMNCSNVANITVPSTIRARPFFDIYLLDLYVLGSDKLYKYSFEEGSPLFGVFPYLFSNTMNITNNITVSSSSAFGCSENANTGYLDCLLNNENDNYVYDTNLGTVTNKTNVVQYIQRQNNYGEGNPYAPFFSTLNYETAVLMWENSQSNKVNSVFINGTNRASCTITATNTQPFGSAFLGGGTGESASFILYSAIISNQLYSVGFNSACTPTLPLVVTSGGFGSNWIVSDIDNDGNVDYGYLTFNSTTNNTVLRQFSSSGSIEYVYPFTNSPSSKGYKETVAVDMSNSYQGKEIIMEDGIFGWNGINYVNIFNLTPYRTNVNGSVLVGHTDATHGVNRAVYAESGKTTVFGFTGENEPITITFCGDGTCDSNNGESGATCPVDCDIYFNEGSQCSVHPTPPCIFEHYFDYTSPIRITHKGFNLFFNPTFAWYPLNQKLDTTITPMQEEVISRYIPYTPAPYYTLELSLNLREKNSCFELVVQDSGQTLDTFDRIDLFFCNRSIDYYYKDSFGQRSIATACKNCYSTNIEQKYKIYFFFVNTPFKLFDNSTNLTSVAKKNTYSILQDGVVIKTDIPFLSTDGLDDGSNFDHISFGLRQVQGMNTLNLTLDNIYLYEGSNNESSNVDELIKDTIKLLNQTTKCYGGFCKKGSESFGSTWDCSVKPQCCGLRSDGSYKANDAWCIVYETTMDIVIRPFIKWIFVSIIIFIILLFIGGTLYVLWLRSQQKR